MLFKIGIIIFVLFIYFSYLVAKDTFTKFDFDTTVKIQNNLPENIDLPFSYFSILGSLEITLILWLLLLFFLIIKRLWWTSAAIFLMPAGLLIEIFGKLYIHHPGPPHLFYRGLIDFYFPSHFVPFDFAYPSGHVFRTTFLTIFLMGYLFFNVNKTKQIFIQPPFILYIFLMLVSRIYLGEHWTSDVIGGFLLGSSLAIFAIAFLPIYEKSSIPH